jgi:lipoprotein Spr
MKRLFVFLAVSVLLLNCTSAPRYTDYERSGKKKKENERIDKKRFSEIMESYLNTRYLAGGETRFGMDCSGLVVAVYRDYAGLKLPRGTAGLFNFGKKIPKGEIEFGDLVFFDLDGKGISHVGIYIGGDRFIHATIQNGVTVSSLQDNYYKKGYMGARRVME